MFTGSFLKQATLILFLTGTFGSFLTGAFVPFFIYRDALAPSSEKIPGSECYSEKGKDGLQVSG